MQHLEACVNTLAWHQARHQAERWANRRAYAAAAGRATGIKRRHFARQQLRFCAISVSHRHPQTYVLGIAGVRCAQRPELASTMAAHIYTLLPEWQRW